MYSESDLDSAVSGGAISAEAASALRAHVAGLRSAPMVDEEHFRLLSGFNDIFVAIAGALLLVAVAWLGGEVHAALGGAAVAATAWGLAEYFTRVRRMALPSILFLLAFVGGVFTAAATALIGDGNVGQGDTVGALLLALSAAIAAGAAYAHWRRFMVPITVAAGAAAVGGVVVALTISAFDDPESVIYPLMIAVGLAVFALAMRWDMSDPARETRRSDVAFWLHLLAAPLIVHPIFALMGLLDGGASIGEAVVVLGVYVALGFVALAIDRRALMVSALAYVLYALGTLFREFGAVSLNVALTALVIGSVLLLLSAFWQSVRASVVGMLPSDLHRALPPVGLTRPTPQPAS